MSIPRKLAALLTVGVTIAVGLAAPASAVTPITTDANWVGGSVPIAQKTICIATCQLYAGGATQVQYQGPIGNIGIVPRVGERFYVHVWAENGWSGTPSEAFKMQALLPDGLEMSIQSASDVQCVITNSSYVQTRNMSPSECQDPTKIGAYWTFPAVEIGAGERANFFFPVVATKAITSANLGVLTDMMRNPETFLPDPMYSTIAVTVYAANPVGTPTPIAGAPATDPSPTADPATAATTTTTTTTTGTDSVPTAALTGSDALVTGVSVSGKTVTWKQPVGPVTKYIVQASSDKTHWKTIGKPTTPKYIWRTAPHGKRWIRVAAVSATGRGAWSPPKRARLL